MSICSSGTVNRRKSSKTATRDARADSVCRNVVGGRSQTAIEHYRSRLAEYLVVNEQARVEKGRRRDAVVAAAVAADAAVWRRRGVAAAAAVDIAAAMAAEYFAW